MPNDVKRNLVVGGVNVHLREHGSKGFEVKHTHNLHYNNGFIFGTSPLTTLAALVASGSAVAVANPNNQIL